MATNVTVFSGRLGQDAKQFDTSNGDGVVKFSIANTRKFKTRDGESREETTWLNVTAWGNVAKGIAQYLVKGKQVTVTGRLMTNEFEKDGVVRKQIELNASEIELGGDARTSDSVSTADEPQTTARSQRRNARSKQHDDYANYDEAGDGGDAPW